MLAYRSSLNSFVFNIICLFIFLGICSVGNAQGDSLSNIPYTKLIDSFKTAIEKDAKQAFVFAKAAHEKAILQNDQKRIGASLYFLAKANNDLANYTDALQQLKKVLQIGSELKDSVLLFKGNVLKGNIHNDLGDESSALATYLEAEKSSAYSEKSNDRVLLFINIAYIKKIHNDHEDAVTILKENLEFLETTTIDPAKKRRYELIILMNLTDTYLRMKENGGSQYIEEAERYHKIGLEKCGDDTDSIFYNVLLMNEAIIQHEKKAYQQSIVVANEVMEKSKENLNGPLLTTAYFYLGKNYFQLENYSKSIDNFNSAYEIMKHSKRKYSNEITLHELLAKSYIKVKDIDKADFHFKLFSTLIKQQSKEDLKVHTTLVKTYDPEIQKERVNRLQHSLDDLKLRKLLLYIASGVLALLLLFSIIFYSRKVQNIKKKFAQVLEKVDALEKNKVAVETKPISTASEAIPDENALKILEKLRKFEEDKAFLVKGCTLVYVAETLGSNTTYLSKVINTYKGKTFNSYINELRINKALVELKNNARLRSYTIKGIAEEFGFKRQETFSRAFKQQTGIYPSQYLKKLNEAYKR